MLVRVEDAAGSFASSYGEAGDPLRTGDHGVGSVLPRKVGDAGRILGGCRAVARSLPRGHRGGQRARREQLRVDLTAAVQLQHDRAAADRARRAIERAMDQS